MRALELVRDRAAREPAPEAARQAIALCHRRGLVILTAGTFGNVIRILVPLAASDAQMEEGLRVLEEALTEVHNAQGGAA
jgi:4-aminobutyrate aminotransferase / (S)-3-amino-2-methylpropionate transaminase / 5-aminovalerate transaminase